jgi:hypothetical protein
VRVRVRVRQHYILRYHTSTRHDLLEILLPVKVKKLIRFIDDRVSNQTSMVCAVQVRIKRKHTSHGGETEH